MSTFYKHIYIFTHLYIWSTFCMNYIVAVHKFLLAPRGQQSCIAVNGLRPLSYKTWFSHTLSSISCICLTCGSLTLGNGAQSFTQQMFYVLTSAAPSIWPVTDNTFHHCLKPHMPTIYLEKFGIANSACKCNHHYHYGLYLRDLNEHLIINIKCQCITNCLCYDYELFFKSCGLLRYFSKQSNIQFYPLKIK